MRFLGDGVFRVQAKCRDRHEGRGQAPHQTHNPQRGMVLRLFNAFLFPEEVTCMLMDTQLQISSCCETKVRSDAQFSGPMPFKDLRAYMGPHNHGIQLYGWL